MEILPCSSASLALERVAITGATGFIGGHLARALVSLGCRPVLLARSPRVTPILTGVADRVQWAPLDLRDPHRLPAILDDVQPTILFHAAGTRGREVPDNAALDCAAVNVCGTVHLLHAAQRAGVRRVVALSSADALAKTPGPMSEIIPLRPGSPYGASMAATAHFARALHAVDGCPVVVATPFTVYGPGQPRDMFVSQAVRAALAGTPFEMTHGRQRRDLIFIDDLVHALVRTAIAPDLEGAVLHLGSGSGVALRDVASLVWQLTESPAPLLIGSRPATETDLHDTWADIGLARSVLGWEPQVDLETGLRATIAWERAHQVTVHPPSTTTACPVT